MLANTSEGFETQQGIKPMLPVISTATSADTKDVRVCPALNNPSATLSRTPFSRKEVFLNEHSFCN